MDSYELLAKRPLIHANQVHVADGNPMANASDETAVEPAEATNSLGHRFTLFCRRQLGFHNEKRELDTPVMKPMKPPFLEEEYPLAISQLGRLGGAIDKEFSLVSDRMTWMVISESFIFSAFTSASVNFKGELASKTLVKCLLILLPLLGIFLAWIVTPAIKAAHSAAFTLKDQRDEFEGRMPKGLQIILISSKGHEHSKGNLPPTWVPRVIIVIWTVLLCVTVWVLQNT